MIRDNIRNTCSTCNKSNILICTGQTKKHRALDVIYDNINKFTKHPVDITNNITGNILPNTIYKAIPVNLLNDWMRGKVRISNLAYYRGYGTSDGIGDTSEGTNNIGDVTLVNAYTGEHIGEAKNLMQGPNINDIYILAFSYSNSIKLEPNRSVVEFFDIELFLNKIIGQAKSMKCLTKAFAGDVTYEVISKNNQPAMMIQCPYYRPEHFVFRKEPTKQYMEQVEYRVAFFMNDSYVSTLSQYINSANHIYFELGDLSDCIRVIN